MKLNGEKRFNLILLVILLTVVIMAFNFTPRARLLPLIVGIPAVLLIVIQIISDFMNKTEKKSLTPEEKSRQLQMIGGVFGLFILILVTGFTMGVTVYLLTFIRFIGRRKWIEAIGVAAIAFVVVFGLFDQLLHYQLYRGLWDLI